MKISRMVKLEKSASGKTAAFFDWESNDGILIKGFKIINGANGLFVVPPNAKGKDGKYYESVVVPKEMKNSLDKMALEAYAKK